MDTIEKKVVVKDNSAATLMWVVVIIILVAAGVWWWTSTHKQAPAQPGVNLNVTLPTSGDNSTTTQSSY